MSRLTKNCLKVQQFPQCDQVIFHGSFRIFFSRKSPLDFVLETGNLAQEKNCFDKFCAIYIKIYLMIAEIAVAENRSDKKATCVKENFVIANVFKCKGFYKFC